MSRVSDIEKAKETVTKGGIFFRCKDCGAEGAIEASHSMAKVTRKNMGIRAPHPCGIEFTKETCPVCKEKK